MESATSEDRRAGKYELLKALEMNKLAFAQQGLTYLNSLDVTKDSSCWTRSNCCYWPINLFIGISIEKVEIDGETIVGISTRAPIYASMKGLKAPFKFGEAAHENAQRHRQLSLSRYES
jgi:hypothetical protein